MGARSFFSHTQSDEQIRLTHKQSSFHGYIICVNMCICVCKSIGGNELINRYKVCVGKQLGGWFEGGVRIVCSNDYKFTILFTYIHFRIVYIYSSGRTILLQIKNVFPLSVISFQQWNVVCVRWKLNITYLYKLYDNYIEIMVST